MKKIFSIIMAICAMFSMTAYAQLTVQTSGRVVAGPTLSNLDGNNVLTMALIGNGTNGAGAKLSFGDFGTQATNSWNVFIGESGNTDSDILWLHGKNGTRITSWDGTYLLAEWGVSSSLMPNFTINDGLHVDRVAVSCDDAHKNDVTPLQPVLPRLMKLKSVMYRYTALDNTIAVSTGTTETELAEEDSEESRRVNNSMQQREMPSQRYGFVASEVAALFPELVEIDDRGQQYVNYLEMIPLMVGALQELKSSLKENGIYVTSMMDAEELSELGLADSGMVAYARSTNEGLALLYQNTPNPFNGETEIEYCIPQDAATAAIYIFNLNGLLLQTLPVSGTGHGTAIVNGESLDAGMYLYSLVVDGRIVDTKRMILTR